jgi:hypothetical protein
MTVKPANSTDAHRPLDKSHSLAASLSHVEMRQVRSDYTFRIDGKFYQIERQAIVSGLRGADVRVEKRLDGSMAVRFGEKYLPIKMCEAAHKGKAPAPTKPAKAQRVPRRGSDWGKNFDLQKAPKIWQVR